MFWYFFPLYYPETYISTTPQKQASWSSALISMGSIFFVLMFRIFMFGNQCGKFSSKLLSHDCSLDIIPHATNLESFNFLLFYHILNYLLPLPMLTYFLLRRLGIDKSTFLERTEKFIHNELGIFHDIFSVFRSFYFMSNK